MPPPVGVPGAGAIHGPGMGGHPGGGGPSRGGSHLYPGYPYRPYVAAYPYAYSPVFVQGSNKKAGPLMPFGLQGKGLLVGVLVGFFLIPWLVRLVSR
jgi:hypothetical protein